MHILHTIYIYFVLIRSKELPCLNCRLIEMGEMACYEDRCPQCGKMPPGRLVVMTAVSTVQEDASRRLEVLMTGVHSARRCLQEG